MNRKFLVPEYLLQGNIQLPNKLTTKINNNSTEQTSDLYEESINIFFDDKDQKDAEKRRIKSLRKFCDYLNNKYNIDPDF